MRLGKTPLALTKLLKSPFDILVARELYCKIFIILLNHFDISEEVDCSE